MADDLSTPEDPRMAAIGQLMVQALLVVHAWHEFGPGADFAREIAVLEAELTGYKRGWQQEGTGG